MAVKKTSRSGRKCARSQAFFYHRPRYEPHNRVGLFVD